MQYHPTWLIIIGSVLIIIVGIYGSGLYQKLTTSVEVEVIQGPLTNDVAPATNIDEETKSRIFEALVEAGLNKEAVLGDTAVSGHMKRLNQGGVRADALLQYAKDLIYLNKFTASANGAIATSFWDVRTPVMEANKWDEYSVVHKLTQPESESYLLLLTHGYARFLKFKSAESSGEDTALDTALDMFAYVEDYYESVPFSALSEHAKELKGETEEILMIWQSLVAGSTRTNPLTKKPIFSHSIFARGNVGTMYQYDQKQGMSISKVWGVSGFANHFVGIPENANQIEHMSISMVLQLILKEPVLILDGLEEEKLLAGHARKEEAYADMALNNAIYREFAPYFGKDRSDAIKRLRSALKTESPKSN